MLQLRLLRVACPQERPLPVNRPPRRPALRLHLSKAKRDSASRSSHFTTRTWWRPRRPPPTSSEAAPLPPAVTQVPALWMPASDITNSRKMLAGETNIYIYIYVSISVYIYICLIVLLIILYIYMHYACKQALERRPAGAQRRGQLLSLLLLPLLSCVWLCMLLWCTYVLLFISFINYR